MEHNSRSNFISGVVMTLFSAIVVLGSLQMYYQADKPFHQSPALMPFLTSSALLLVSVLLLIKSLRNGGFGRRVTETATWFRTLAKSSYTWKTVGGIGLMGLYIYLMVPQMPFWAASTIFMIVLMFLLKAGRWWMILIVSVGLIGTIYLIFSFALHAPLP